MKKLALAQGGNTAERMEITQAYTLPPWHSRLPIGYDLDRDMATETANTMEGILAATSASEKAGRVGMGGIVRDTLSNRPGDVVARFSIMIGSRDDQNVYTAELEAIATALRCMPDGLQHRQLTVMTSSRSALQVIARPQQQSGQCTVQEIHRHAERLQKSGNIIKMLCVPAGDKDFPMGSEAKTEARRAARGRQRPEKPTYQARSTRMRLAIAQQQRQKILPDGVGKYAKRIDRALPGTHTRALYDGLKRREADMLSQLRTGMARINSYLHRIGAAETMDHFLFRCTKWDTQRGETNHRMRKNVGLLGDANQKRRTVHSQRTWPMRLVLPGVINFFHAFIG
jgi:hypothetical protein